MSFDDPLVPINVLDGTDPVELLHAMLAMSASDAAEVRDKAATAMERKSPRE